MIGEAWFPVDRYLVPKRHVPGGYPAMEIKKEAIEQNSDLCSYSPKTSPGRRLLEIRTKIIASGEHMLDWDEIEKEVAGRRGRFENSTR
jgi:hypothetical protein